MKQATITVLHSFPAADGIWRLQGEETTLPEDEARKLEASGYVDVLSVDGAVEVWAPCCGGQHDH